MYASYRLDDGVSFVHIASVQDPTYNPLQAFAEFKHFTSGLGARCAMPPVTLALHEVGSYSDRTDNS